MYIEVKHDLPRKEAKKRVKDLLTNLEKEHADVIAADSELEWENYYAKFKAKIKGHKVKGEIVVAPDYVSIEGELPLLLKLAGKKIKGIIRKHLKNLLDNSEEEEEESED